MIGRKREYSSNFEITPSDLSRNWCRYNKSTSLLPYTPIWERNEPTPFIFSSASISRPFLSEKSGGPETVGRFSSSDIVILMKVAAEQLVSEQAAVWHESNSRLIAIHCSAWEEFRFLSKLSPKLSFLLQRPSWVIPCSLSSSLKLCFGTKKRKQWGGRWKEKGGNLLRKNWREDERKSANKIWITPCTRLNCIFLSAFRWKEEFSASGSRVKVNPRHFSFFYSSAYTKEQTCRSSEKKRNKFSLIASTTCFHDPE